MKKLTKTLSFISLGVIGASCMAVLLCCVYSKPLMELFFHRGEELPTVIPVADAVLLLGHLAAMIWLCVCVGNRRFGIWSELLAAGWLGAVLPGAYQMLAYVQSILLGKAMGTDYMIAQSYMSNLWNYATVLNWVAVAMALVVCGLSIASKHFEKCHHTVDACENVSYHIDH